MTTKQLQDQLSLLIIRSSMRGKYAMLNIAEDHNITLTQAMTLCLLEPNQSVPMKTLSTFMACDPSNLTTIAEQLVMEGLVSREEAKYDRRVKTLTLTDAGLALRDEFLEATTGTRLPHLSSLTDAEVEQLTKIVEKAAGASLGRSLVDIVQEA